MFSLDGVYRIMTYYTEGVWKGMTKSCEYFFNLEDVKVRYRELFKKELFSLNPTVWHMKDGEWHRLEGI